MSKDPSGVEMLNRANACKPLVKKLMIAVPQTNGDDLLMLYHFWKRHSFIRISFQRFKDLFTTISPESVRRRQEINEEERFKQAMGYEYDKRLLPTDRVLRKRRRDEEAHRHYYGTGLRLTDYI